MAKVNERDREVAELVAREDWNADRAIATYREEIEARYAGVVDALIKAREYVKAIDGTMAFVDSGNRLTKPDLDMIDSALAKIGRG